MTTNRSSESADSAFGPGQMLRGGGSWLWEDPAGLRGCRGALPAGAVGWGWNPDRPAGGGPGAGGHRAEWLHRAPVRPGASGGGRGGRLHRLAPAV